MNEEYQRTANEHPMLQGYTEGIHYGLMEQRGFLRRYVRIGA